MGKSEVVYLAPVFLLLALALALKAVDPLCDGLPTNDIFPFPHEYNCSLYYECYNGNKTVLSCPDDMYYNSVIQSCDFPEQSGCRNKDPICANVEIDYFPYSEDCSKYIECFHGDSFLMACPNGFYFHSIKKLCVVPSESDCVINTSSTSPTWTTPHPICWGVRPNQTVLVPYEGDCHKYWTCNGSQKTLHLCPSGLYFDEGKQMCDFPANVDCDDTTGTPDPSTVTPPVTPTTQKHNDPRCFNEESVSFWPDSVFCDKYIECYYGATYYMDCPEELYFSDDLKKCTIFSESDCGKTVKPTQGTTSERPTGWTSDPDCPFPEGEGKLLPYPGDCTKYYECAEGKKVEMPCPANLWFNPIILECDYPYQANCEWGY